MLGFTLLALLSAFPRAHALDVKDMIRTRDLEGLRVLLEMDLDSARRPIRELRRDHGDRYESIQYPPLFYLLSNDLSRGAENVLFRRQAMRLLLDAGADSNEPVRVQEVTDGGSGPFQDRFWPIHFTNSADEIAALDRAGANLDQLHYLGDAKIHELSRQVISRDTSSDDDTNDMLRALIRGGADVTVENRSGETALELATAALYRAKRKQFPDAREIADNEERVEILKQAEQARIRRQIEEIRRRVGGAPGGSSGGELNERRPAATPEDEEGGAIVKGTSVRVYRGR